MAKFAPKIDETIARSPIERDRAIQNAGYAAAKAGYNGDANPYWDGDDGDSEAWNDGFCEYLDREPDYGD